MGNHALVPAETKQDASLRDALRGALDHTPGTQTHTPVVFPAAALARLDTVLCLGAGEPAGSPG